MDIQEKFDQAGHRLECDPRIWRVASLDDFALFHDRSEITPAVNAFVCDMGLSDALKKAAENYYNKTEHRDTLFLSDSIFEFGHPRLNDDYHELTAKLRKRYQERHVEAPMQLLLFQLSYAFKLAKLRDHVGLTIRKNSIDPPQNHVHGVAMTVSLLGGGTVFSETPSKEDASITYEQKPGEIAVFSGIPHRAVREAGNVRVEKPRLNIVVA